MASVEGTNVHHIPPVGTRRSARVVTRIPLKLSIGDHSVAAVTVDITQHAALIMSPIAVPCPGSMFVQNERTGEWAAVRIVRVRANDAGFYAVGVEFTHATGSSFWRGEDIDTFSI